MDLQCWRSKRLFNPFKLCCRHFYGLAVYAGGVGFVGLQCDNIRQDRGRIGKLIQAQEAKGLAQKELAEMAGVKQPAITRLEGLKATPQIDTLFKVLHPLGYTLDLVPHNRSNE